MKQIISIILLYFFVNNIYAQNYLVTDYGVSNADSTILNTKILQNIIDKAEANGGGTIQIPKGVYLTGALFFKKTTHLKLMEGAVLKGSDDINDYPLIPSRMEGRNQYYYAALVNAYYVDSFSISGPGTIDGNGLHFWKYFWAYRDSVKKTGRNATNLEVHRPRLIFLWGCNNVKIQNTHLQNSGFWTTHLYQCNNVLIEGCKITAPFKPVPAPSSDGIDIDVCKKVTVRHCYISVNDDAVCIKGGKGPTAHLQNENGVVEDILIEDCDFGDSHGTLTVGSESIFARNITVRNCRMDNHCPILRLKMRPDTYQKFENISIENITGKCGTLFTMAPWKQFFDMGGSTEKPFGIVNNIRFSNIKVQCKSIAEINGNEKDTVNNFVFDNIVATAETPVIATKYVNITTKNVVVNEKPFTMNQ